MSNAPKYMADNYWIKKNGDRVPIDDLSVEHMKSIIRMFNRKLNKLTKSRGCPELFKLLYLVDENED